MKNLRIKNGHKENANATDPGAGGNAKAARLGVLRGDPQGQDVWAIIWCAVLAISGPIRAEVRACQGARLGGAAVALADEPYIIPRGVNFKGFCSHIGADAAVLWLFGLARRALGAPVSVL